MKSISARVLIFAGCLCSLWSCETASPATLLPNGKALAPPDAPIEVKRLIAAANSIVGSPYVMGGGHSRTRSCGYDCSGTASYALGGAGLLNRPLSSKEFANYGRSGRGTWVTVYSRPGHVFLVVCGLRLDAVGNDSKSPTKGPAWYPKYRCTDEFAARHPRGL